MKYTIIKKGRAFLNPDIFPEYHEETLVREQNAFGAFDQIVQILSQYENRFGEISDSE